jgi:hypothetical protein
LETINKQLCKFGVQIPELIMPGRGLDLKKWAVIACDQWTQDRAYWKDVEKFVGKAPSTLNMILPEIYLNDADKPERIQKIHDSMAAYLASVYTDDAVLTPPRRAGAFIERETDSGRRRGLIIAIDLDQYDWRKGSQTLIRATEGTIESRIPPRMEVRRGAPLETPHILLLIDDVEDMMMSVITKLMRGAPYAYDSPLMMNSGSVRSRLLYRKNDWSFIFDTLELLYRKFCTRYNSENGFLFAVGDGNHSLATAKAVWDEYKTAHAGEVGIETHPARYALVEIVNLYDPALIFHPIHRVLFGIELQTALDALKSLPQFSSKEIRTFKELSALVRSENAGKNRIGLVSGKSCFLVEFAANTIAGVLIEPLLDKLMAGSPAGTSIDYIHGEEELTRLAKGNVTGILMPPFLKEKLFETVHKNGVLPRKTFSMGEPSEKRFYLECRKIS